MDLRCFLIPYFQVTSSSISVGGEEVQKKVYRGRGGFCDWIWMRMLMLDEEGMEGRGKRERGRWNMTAWWEMTES